MWLHYNILLRYYLFDCNHLYTYVLFFVNKYFIINSRDYDIIRIKLLILLGNGVNLEKPKKPARLLSLNVFDNTKFLSEKPETIIGLATPHI